MVAGDPPAEDARPTAEGAGALGELHVLHLDMDCFFAAVEALDHPELRGRPVVVGGVGARGVVASASYEARAFGVTSAMPTGEARRRCPRAIFVSPRHGRYAEVSRTIHALMSDVTPLIEPIALDEAYLDVAGSVRLFGDAAGIALSLQGRILDELGLRCSVGVARNKLIAKLASKAAKPRPDDLAGLALAMRDLVAVGPGVLAVPVACELAFLHAHPVRALPGVGPATHTALRRFGVSSVGDLAAVPRESLERLLGVAHGSSLYALAHGEDDRAVTSEREMRSIGHEETFAVDLRDRDELVRRAREMGRAVASRLREADLRGRTVTVKVRLGDFSTRTRSRTLGPAEAELLPVAETAAQLLADLELVGGVRLLGVAVSGLNAIDEAEPRQLNLFGEDAAPDQAATREQLADAIRGRFGEQAISSRTALSRREVVRDDGTPPGAGAGRTGGR